MDKRRIQGEIKAALDTALSGLQDDPWLAQRVMAEAKGEKKVKKKISTGLALIFVLVLLAATALAVATLREAAQMIAQTEQESGYFADWPAEKKIMVVTALADQGYIEDTDEIRQMREGELDEMQASRMADDLISAFTGWEADSIGFMAIMQAAWGPFDTWSDEDRAWYSMVMEDVGVKSEGKTVYVLPEGEISREEAAQIAKREVAKDYGVDESVLNNYRMIVNFQIPEFSDTGEPYWYVLIEAPQEMEDRLFYDIELFVHPQTGELLQSVEEILEIRANLPKRPDNALYQAIDAYHDRAAEMGAYAFSEWPLELRAEYSREIAPKVRAIVESGDLTELMNCGSPDIGVIAQSAYDYGIPDETAILQEDAYALAKAALSQAYGLPMDLFSKYSEVFVYYDVTDRPLWKFSFNPNFLDVQELEGGFDNPYAKLCYKAEIDSHTGETVHTDEFPFQFPGQDLEYDLKWY